VAEMIYIVAHKSRNDDWQKRKRLLLTLYMLLSKLKHVIPKQAQTWCWAVVSWSLTYVYWMINEN